MHVAYGTFKYTIGKYHVSGAHLATGPRAMAMAAEKVPCCKHGKQLPFLLKKVFRGGELVSPDKLLCWQLAFLGSSPGFTCLVKTGTRQGTRNYGRSFYVCPKVNDNCKFVEDCR